MLSLIGHVLNLLKKFHKTKYDFLLFTEPTYVIMEYVSKGKLQEFLRKSRAEHYYGNLHGSSQKLTSRDLTSFCYQVLD